MEIIGYKCFNKDMTNRYGKKLEVGKIYSTNNEVKFGNDGHGFHFCKNIEDTFRYFDAMNEEVSICLVRGFGNIDEFEDDHNGYYDMYASENIEIIKELSREEIITIGLNLYPDRAKRFVSGIRLSDDEIEMFKEKYKTSTQVLKTIDYYQLGDKDAYKR